MRDVQNDYRFFTKADRVIALLLFRFNKNDSFI